MQCFYENELFKNKSRRQIKSFSVQQFFKNAAGVWASSPHLRSKSRLYHKIKQKSKKQSKESQLPSKSEGCNERYGFRGNCDSQASWGCAPALPNRFRVVFLRAMFHMKQSEIHCNCSPGTVAKLLLTASGKQGEAVLFARLEKLSLFSPPPPCAKSMAQGFRCLRAAIRATRPEPRQHF